MNFVVAYLAEAQPVIDYYDLKKVDHASIPLFQNDQHSLVLSGLGKNSATSATQNLSRSTNNPNGGWINLGISGHGSLAKGDLFIAGKILDDNAKETFYPPQLYASSITVSTLKSCSKPSMEYQEGMGYDMEAHAFYKTACQFTTRELIQVVKVVSDNPSFPLDQFSPKDAPVMINQHLQRIDDLVKQIEETSNTFQIDDKVEEMFESIGKIHSFSVTRSHQLQELVRHAKNLNLDLGVMKEIAQSSTNAGEAIKNISEFLEPYRTLG